MLGLFLTGFSESFLSFFIFSSLCVCVLVISWGSPLCDQEPTSGISDLRPVEMSKRSRSSTMPNEVLIGPAKAKRPVPQRRSPRVQVQRTTKQEHVRNGHSALPSRRRAQQNSFISRTSRERRRGRREDGGSLNRGSPIVGRDKQSL